jgi:hypothetical protein
MTDRISTCVSLVAVALLLAACASGGSAAGAGGAASSSLAYGYMIPGAGVASTMGVGANDTIPELTTRATVSTTLSNAIGQEVAAGKWDNRCTRRFGGPSTYVVIFHRACDSSLGPDADPMVVVGFSSDGRKIGQVRWTGPSTITLLYPARRF